MQEELYREKSMHGSLLFPFECYIQNSSKPIIVKNYHWHEETEWIYTVEGNITIDINMHAYHVGPNSLVWIPKESLHKIRTEGKCLYYAYVYKFEMLHSSLYDYCESEYMLPIEKGDINFLKVINLDEEENQIIKKELQDIANICKDRLHAWRLCVKASLTKIVALLIQNNKMEDAMYQNQTDKIEKVANMKRILQYINEHYQEKIYIKELADIISMNETYFCRYFKRIVGKTPIEYMNDLRIEKAARKIRETDLSITEICFLVGFENVSYFIRKFKENKLITPKKYSALKD